jgi:hypothetical protein
MLYKAIYIPVAQKEAADDILRELKENHPWFDFDQTWDTCPDSEEETDE